MLTLKVVCICASLVVQCEAARLKQWEEPSRDQASAADNPASTEPTVWWPFSVSGGENNVDLAADASNWDGTSEETDVSDSDRSFWWPWEHGDHRSPFEKYRDESKDHCPPFLSRSTCPDSEYKGLVVYFHGYSACAEQIRYVAPHLNDGCLDVIAPTMPGHGGGIMNCAAGDHCDVDIGGGQGFDLRELPTHAHGYRRYVWRVNRLVRDERDHRASQTGKRVRHLTVAAMGLSFGGPIAQYAIMSWRGLYTKNLAVNPYFGVGPDIDPTLLDCERDAMTARQEQGWFGGDWRERELDCRHRKIMDWLSEAGVAGESNMILDWVAARNGRFERKLMKTLVQLSDVYGHLDASRIDIPPLKALLDGQMTWGENCGPIRAGAQKGICAFKTAHLLATHSFAQHVLVQGTSRSSYSFPDTQIITTQKDGRTRNGLTYALARHLKNTWMPWAPDVSMCMYRGGTVPHANLDKPGGWWNGHLYGQVTHFLTGDGAVSAELTSNINAAECSALPLNSGALRRDPELGMLVLPEAAPRFAVELWPGPLWLLLRTSDDFADLFLWPVHMRERHLNLHTVFNSNTSVPGEGRAESGDDHHNDPSVGFVSGVW